MKYKGESIDGPQPEFIVIPKGDRRFVFTAVMVRDFSIFDEICPIPKPVLETLAGAKKATPVLDEAFDKKITEYATFKTHWLILESLKESEDVEWETVNMNAPATYGNYQDELREAGFSDMEISKIVALVTSVNGNNPALIEEATKSFLAGQAELLAKQ